MASESDRWAERVFLDHSKALAVVFSVFYCAALAFLIASLASGPLLGVSVSAAISALLALGTLTLAYAAIVSALLAVRSRRAQIAPRLDLEFSRLTISPQSGQGEWVPQVTGLIEFPLPLPSGESFRFLVRNMGSGAAVGVRIWGRYWQPRPAPDPNAVPGQLSGPLMEDPFGYRSFTDSLSIPAGEERAFPIQLYSAAPGVRQPGQPEYLVVSQIVLSAEGTDVGGRPVRAPPIGIFYMEAIQTGPSTGPRTVTTWVLVTEQIAERLAMPIPPGVQGTWASRLLPKEFWAAATKPP